MQFLPKTFYYKNNYKLFKDLFIKCIKLWSCAIKAGFHKIKEIGNTKPLREGRGKKEQK